MSDALSRRRFMQAAVAAGTAVSATNLVAASGPKKDSGTPGRDPNRKRAAFKSNLVLNDDGHVFLCLNDNLTKKDLQRYIQSYCREGVGAIAYCVGDMTWPAFYPSRLVMHRSDVDYGGKLKAVRVNRNLENFSQEKGGYFGTAFRIVRELGKKALASFRMNDAHLTSAANKNASRFWQERKNMILGKQYGYYGGCLNYAFELVRDHFKALVKEFAELYPEIDGVELDAMRSPFFFPPDKGKECAPLFTGMVREIKEALHAQAKRLKRPDYLLTTNVPTDPEVALQSGLDVAAWDAEGLFDYVSTGPYQAYMNHPMDKWKQVAKNGTPIYAYIGCSPQTGQYLGLEEYRAAAANALAGGADGIYLFNYPCLFELSSQVPHLPKDAGIELPDLRCFRQLDLSKAPQALDEIASADRLRHKNKRFLFNWIKNIHYRHFAPEVARLNRDDKEKGLEAVFRCYEDYDRAKELTLRFKIENVARSEQFEISLNGKLISAEQQRVLYAANGRDTRIHTVKLEPYSLCSLSLKPGQLKKGENTLSVRPAKLNPDLAGDIYLLEIELIVKYE